MSEKAGAQHGEKRRYRDAQFVAIDWFPHVNKAGVAVPVLCWAATCDRCGGGWRATSAAGKVKFLSPVRCRVCR